MRIFEHLKSKWFHYGFETLAVVVGILAAFALESWNEERQYKDQTSAFLHNIVSNINEDMEELASQMDHLDLTIERAESLITSYKTASSNPGMNHIISSIIWKQPGFLNIPESGKNIWMIPGNSFWFPWKISCLITN